MRYNTIAYKNETKAKTHREKNVSELHVSPNKKPNNEENNSHILDITHYNLYTHGTDNKYFSDSYLDRMRK